MEIKYLKHYISDNICCFSLKTFVLTYTITNADSRQIGIKYARSVGAHTYMKQLYYIWHIKVNHPIVIILTHKAHINVTRLIKTAQKSAKRRKKVRSYR